MVKTVDELLLELKDYKQPLNKINRLISDGELIQLKKGLYETSNKTNPFVLARPILSPSYISFETALSYYGLIPERVYAITSASLNKRKSKLYRNYYGTYIYMDIPERAYSFGVMLAQDSDGNYFQIATKEKALCDKLYKLPPRNNIKELEELLLNDLRIEYDDICLLNKDDIIFLAERYHTTNVDLLNKYLRRISK